jgi:tetratricopeptide (TPR) repeat protein
MAASGDDEIRRLLHVGFAALTEGRLDAAANACRRILAFDQRRVEAHFLVGLIATEQRDRKTAISAFGSVTRLEPTHVAAWSQLARQLVQLGQPGRAERALAQAVAIGTADPVVMDLIGTVCSALGDQFAAERWYQRASSARPNVAGYRLNLANTLIFLGRNAEAQQALARALELEPDHPQGHWLLAGSRPATSTDHIVQLERLARMPGIRPQACAFFNYAAGKEYEDLGHWPDAFAAFERGARAKRSIVDYDEAAEQATFDALQNTFTPAWLARAAPGHDDPSPIFVVGQPRTGTTLIERIITSHSDVHSAGELQQFGLAVRRIVDIPSVERLSADIVRAAAAIEPKELGAAYIERVASLRGTLPRFVDKLPVNFMYLPLIATALPRAKIVHLVRDPIDSCFACFKQLFADAYLHSYDLTEMARHYVRYRRLMDHWRALLPGRFIDVVYEDVVADFEPQARRLIAHLDLPWQDACLDFHRQSGAVTTASAVQVREPVHTRSVARWRRYEDDLAPMIDVLRHSGIV